MVYVLHTDLLPISRKSEIIQQTFALLMTDCVGMQAMHKQLGDCFRNSEFCVFIWKCFVAIS